MVTINGAQPEDPIETFKDLCQILDCRPKAANVLSQVSKKMELHFNNNFRGINISEGIKNVSYQNFQICLPKNRTVNLTQSWSVEDLLTRYLSISSISWTHRKSPRSPTTYQFKFLICNKSMDMEGHSLHQCFRVLSDQTILILNNVTSLKGGNSQSIKVSGL